jgi:hypothetical protein
MDSLVAQWRKTRSSPYISPNLARAHHARKYAGYLKTKAASIERDNKEVQAIMLQEADRKDLPLVRHHINMFMNEQYNTVILPLLYQAMQVERTVEELLLSVSDPPPPAE